jgi:membrane protease YdiL (CAAX protease family)
VTEDQENLLNVRIVLLVYGVLLALAVGWGWLQGDPNIIFLPAVRPEWRLWGSGAKSYWGAVVAGLGVGLAVVALSRLGTRCWDVLRRMEKSFGALLGSLSPAQILVMAAASAVAEEALFRGVLLPLTGLWISSAIFGLLHMAPDRNLRIWPLMAFVMGLGFGVLALLFGNIIAPIIAHFVINFMNLRSIVRKSRPAAVER